MAEAAVSVAVEKVANLLIEKIRFLQKVERKLNLLKDELVRMQCFLKDAGGKQAADESVRHWVSEMRKVAQDVEDVVEIFSVEVEAPRRARGIMAKLACFPIYLHRVNSIGGEISLINTKLKAIDESRERFGIQPEEIRRLQEGPGESRRRLPPWEKDKHAVGLTKDVEVLLSKAVRPGMKKGRTVVAGIVGMGGAGKSTLARIVYNHREAVGGFNCRAWVVVSSEFRERDVIEEVVRQLWWPGNKRKASEETENLKMQELRHKLFQLLKGKRY